jgi:hypothetical protein
LLVGELFRLYRRRLRGVVVVCALCKPQAQQKSWVPVVGPTYRQQSKRSKTLRMRPVRAAAERTPVA